MENAKIEKPNDLDVSKKNKWGFSSGCTGRDLTYTLVALYFLTFIQYTCNLTAAQFTGITVIIILCRVWDAVNDPMMSTIITNTKTKQGRYKPWILIGSLVNSIFLVGLFLSPGLTGWGYVAYLGVMYLMWGMSFTMNDVAYWSMIPHLAKSKKSRDQLTGYVAIFASVGQFITGGLVPILTTGNMINGYRIYAIVAACVFIACQVMVYIVVKDPDTSGVEKNVSLKQMFKIIFNNKQLLVMSAVVLMYSLASALLTTFGTNFFYFKFGYDGTYMTIFTVVFAVGTLIAQFLFQPLAKKYTRAQLVKWSTYLLVVGYLIFFLLANMPIAWVGGSKITYLVILCVFGCVIFAGQGVFYLAMLVMLTNTIEYDEWKTGVRNEAISFSVRPFMVKLASAFQQLILTIVLLSSGLYSITQGLSQLESDKASGTVTNITDSANQLLAEATPVQIMGLTIGMCIVPVILFICEYILIKKKYIIDEKMYDQMIKDIEARKEQKECVTK